MRIKEHILEIVGNDDQIREIRDYIKEDPSDDNKGPFIDFNKIVSVPEELNFHMSSDLNFVHTLLFGELPRLFFDQKEDEDYGENETDEVEDSLLKDFEPIKQLQKKFKELSDDKKREGLEMAIKYQSIFEKYGTMDLEEWRMKNWGTHRNAFNQSLTTENTIEFLTEEDSAKEVIIKLSEIFPHAVFNLFVMDPEYQMNSKMGDGFYIICYSISNGEFTYCHMNEYGDKRSCNVDYSDRVDVKINKYRQNYKL